MSSGKHARQKGFFSFMLIALSLYVALPNFGIYGQTDDGESIIELQNLRRASALYKRGCEFHKNYLDNKIKYLRNTKLRFDPYQTNLRETWLTQIESDKAKADAFFFEALVLIDTYASPDSNKRFREHHDNMLLQTDLSLDKVDFQLHEQNLSQQAFESRINLLRGRLAP